LRPVEVRAMPLCGTGLRRRKYGESGFARTAFRFKIGSWPATVRMGRSACCRVAGFRRRPLDVGSLIGRELENCKLESSQASPNRRLGKAP